MLVTVPILVQDMVWSARQDETKGYKAGARVGVSADMVWVPICYGRLQGCFFRNRAIVQGSCGDKGLLKPKVWSQFCMELIVLKLQVWSQV